MFKKIGVVVGFFVALALYFALPLPPGEAAGWWQFIVVIIGLPVLYDQLKKIAEEARKKPEISIGLAHSPSSKSDIKAEEDLPTEIHLVMRGSNTFFLLVIQNRGKLTAKFVKIHWVKLFKDKTDRPRVKFWIDDPATKKLFEKQGEKDYIFNGGADWIIYSNDIARFKIELTQDPNNRIKTDDYFFDCTVWTEGLDNPVSERLMVKITY